MKGSKQTRKTFLGLWMGFADDAKNNHYIAFQDLILLSLVEERFKVICPRVIQLMLLVGMNLAAQLRDFETNS